MKRVMCRIAALALTATALAAVGLHGFQPPEPRTLVIMSYNIRNGIGADNRRDLARTAEVIRRSAPDFVALQEVDSATRRSKGRNVADELGRLTGMHALYGRAIGYEGGGYGIALLTREEPLAVRRIPLPGREEARLLLMAEFAEWWVCVTHLSLTPREQRISLRRIIRATDTCRKPVLLAGDFNMTQSDEVERRLDPEFRILSDTTLRTYPAGAPTQLLDYIAGRDLPEGCTVVRSWSDAATKASDHSPLWVELSLEP